MRSVGGDTEEILSSTVLSDSIVDRELRTCFQYKNVLERVRRSESISIYSFLWVPSLSFSPFKERGKEVENRKTVLDSIRFGYPSADRPFGLFTTLPGHRSPCLVSVFPFTRKLLTPGQTSNSEGRNKDGLKSDLLVFTDWKLVNNEDPRFFLRQSQSSFGS